MKKIMMLVATVCATLNMNANVIDNDQFNNVNVADTISHLTPDSLRVALKRNRYLLEEEQTQSHVLSASTPSEWGANWFVGAQAGASVYVGKPLGCADAFDRISPNIHVYAGKWFTPAVGVRVNYQGYQVKGYHLGDMSMQSYHADLMYNVMSYRYNHADDLRFDLVPFAGCGLIHNSDLHRSDFSLNYGILAKYHLNDHLHLTAEASGLCTFQQFDGHGASDKLGDHKFDVSLGLAVNIGRVGFRSLSAVCHCGDNASCQCSDCSGKCTTDGNCGQQHTKNESTKQALVNGSDTLGLTIPYICYFKINTHNLTNNSQLERSSSQKAMEFRSFLLSINH